MRRSAAIVPLLMLFTLVSPAFGQESVKPEAVVEKMAFKLVRGLTNVGTSIVEIPKQSYLSVRDRGNIGYVIGPLKGLGMGIYRALIGSVEAVFFMVPQPGYYDPMVDPEYVWKGWEERRAEPVKGTSETEQAVPPATPGGKS